MNAPPWHQVRIALDADTPEEKLDVLSGELFGLGAQGVEIEDAETRTIPPLGARSKPSLTAVGGAPVVLVASFPPELDPSELPGGVTELLTGLELAGEVSIAPVAPVDWSAHWRSHFHAMGFGRIWIVPTWLDPPPEAEVVLRLDPGMAFGTGSHETTALCLERIAELSPIARVLDVGTGTGVLAIAARLLGAGRVVGTDNDPDALVVAAENAAQNQVSGIELSSRAPRELEGEFELVVANILSETIVELAEGLAERVAPGGRLLLSGILVDQAERVRAAFRALGFDDGVVTTRGEWVRIEHRRP